MQANANSKKNIWILEDDEGARFVYDEVLSKRYEIKFYLDLKSLKDDLTEFKKPDALIADLRLPDGTFLDLFKENIFSKFPFIVVSSMDDLDTLESCFNEGASDFLAKPFNGNELVYKLNRLLEKAGDDRLKIDTLSKKIILSEGKEIQLTPKEMHVLFLLKKDNNAPKARSEIIKEVWGGVTVTGKTLDVHMFNLRRKISQLEWTIKFIEPDKYCLLSNGMNN